MTETLDPIYAYVLENEGPYDDHPDDPGGPTAWGINQTDLLTIGFLAEDCPAALRNLSPAQSASYIRQLYADPIHLDDIKAPAVRAKTLDNALWLGPGTAIEILQRACIATGHDVQIDNILGPQTAAAANAEPATLLNALMAANAVRHVLRVLGPSARLAEFRDGWLRRALRIPPLDFGG
jgi:lysozyme family protein